MYRNGEISSQSLQCTHSVWANVNQNSNSCFFDSVTPQTLEAALEIKEISREEHGEDLKLLEDDLHDWVFFITLYGVQYI